MVVQGQPQEYRNEECEDEQLLEIARPEGGESLDDSDGEGAEDRRGIGDEAAEDAADQRFEPDQEPGIVVQGGEPDTAPTKAARAKATSPATSARNPMSRAPSRLTAVARSALPRMARPKKK